MVHDDELELDEHDALQHEYVYEQHDDLENYLI